MHGDVDASINAETLVSERRRFRNEAKQHPARNAHCDEQSTLYLQILRLRH